MKNIQLGGQKGRRKEKKTFLGHKDAARHWQKRTKMGGGPHLTDMVGQGLYSIRKYGGTTAVCAGNGKRPREYHGTFNWHKSQPIEVKAIGVATIDRGFDVMGGGGE